MRGPATSVGVALLVVAIGSGCGGPAPERPTGPRPLLGTPVGGEEREESRPQAPDLGPRERWATPFAVTAAGGIVPNEPRSVILLDVDPAIAAGMETQRAIEATLPERPPRVVATPDETADGRRGEPSPEEGSAPAVQRGGDVPRPDTRVMPAPQPG